MASEARLSPHGVSLVDIAVGDPTGLLLTPLPYDRRVWTSFPTELSARMGLVIASWPGLEEHRLLPFRQLDVAEGMLDLAPEADLVIAFGHDCPVAVSLADDPRVGALVLVDPSALELLDEVADAVGEDVEETLDKNIKNVPRELMAAFENKDAKTLGRLGVGGYAEWLTPADLRLVSEIITDNADAVWGRLGLVASNVFWIEQFQEVSIPTLLMTSGDNKWASAQARALAQRNPAARLELLDTQTELPWLEDGPGLARLIGDFADDVLGPNP